VQVYKILSILLQYPTQESLDHWDEIKALVPKLDHIQEQDKQAIVAFMQWTDSLLLTEQETVYVKTFDFTPEHALYLTHHLFDEQDRDRGPALVNLSEYFQQQGFEISDNELPDYLPLVLEYVSTLDSILDVRLFLQQSAHVAEIVATNLEKIDSPYAPLLRIVERHGRLVKIAA
jgi:nitrate reductase delta subunit